MKVIIAGSRGLKGLGLVSEAVDNVDWPISEVVSGCADGIDRRGEQWAKINEIPVKQFPANWKLYGKSAGARRNVEMAVYADALIAIWDGKSKGTLHMINCMVAKQKPVFVYCPT